MKHCRGKPYRYDNGFRMMTSVSRENMGSAVSTFNGVGIAAISTDADIGLVAGDATVMATK